MCLLLVIVLMINLFILLFLENLILFGNLFYYMDMYLYLYLLKELKKDWIVVFGYLFLVVVRYMDGVIGRYYGFWYNFVLFCIFSVVK